MSVRMGNRDHIPNWISENDWSAEKRLDWISRIMAFSPRDWSVKQKQTLGAPDPELWAIWCLACSDTKEEALESWWDFCDPQD